MLILIAGLVLFLGIHSTRIVAPAWTRHRIAEIGEGRYRLIYSLVSAVGLVLIVWGYAVARNAVPVWSPPTFTQHIALVLMIFAFIAVSAYALPAGRLKPMLKHPMLVAIKIWAVAHLLANGDLASILLFGAFLAWAVADRISVKRRVGAEAGAGVPPRGPIVWDAGVLVLAALLYVAFVLFLHQWLFGVSPIALG